jgi:hypothetical protein
MAIFPDGRLWMDELEPGNYSTWSVVPILNTQHYIGKSDWADAAMDHFRLATIRSDGSLWTVSNQSMDQRDAYSLIRIGLDNDWLRVGGWGTGFLLIKKDGTLWLWGRTNDWSWSEDELRADLKIPPKRISDDTNWLGFVHPNSGIESFIEKSDQGIWMLQWTSRQREGSLELNPLPEPFQDIISGTYIYNGNNDWMAAVTTNGQLLAYHSIMGVAHIVGHVEKFQLGEGQKWRGVTFTTENSIIALRLDGTLWEWGPHWPGRDNPVSAKPHQLGTYSRWVALRPINGRYEGSVALAADGSLWCWEAPSDHVWLAPSRKPVYMGNIFEEGDSGNQPATPIKTHESSD